MMIVILSMMRGHFSILMILLGLNEILPTLNARLVFVS